MNSRSVSYLGNKKFFWCVRSAIRRNRFHERRTELPLCSVLSAQCVRRSQRLLDGPERWFVF